MTSSRHHDEHKDDLVSSPRRVTRRPVLAVEIYRGGGSVGVGRGGGGGGGGGASSSSSPSEGGEPGARPPARAPAPVGWTVWDYSAANVASLARLGVRARHVPIGIDDVGVETDEEEEEEDDDEDEDEGGWDRGGALFDADAGTGGGSGDVAARWPSRDAAREVGDGLGASDDDDDDALDARELDGFADDEEERGEGDDAGAAWRRRRRRLLRPPIDVCSSAAHPASIWRLLVVVKRRHGLTTR